MSFKLIKLISVVFCCLTFNQSAKTTELENKTKYNNSKRIITLTSLSTDIVNKISPERLIAIPGSSLFKNKKEFDKLPIVSSGRTPPNLEKIVSLKPDLVIGTEGFHDKILNKLDSINIETHSYKLSNWNDLENLTKLISSKVGINYLESSKPIIDNYLDRCILKKVNKNTPNLVVLASIKPILSPNSKSWAGSLLKRFGLNSLTKDLDSKSEFRGYVNLSPEWLVKEDPDNLIIIQTRPGQYVDFEKSIPFSNLRAVKSKQVYKFNYYGLINAGSLESINNTCLKLRKIF